MTVLIPPVVEVRTMVNSVQSMYSSAKMVTRRQVSRSDENLSRIQRVLTTELTDRQRATLEAAYHAGFFESPRASSGEDVARSLGVSASTFHQHLRLAEKKVFDAFLSERSVGEP